MYLVKRACLHFLPSYAVEFQPKTGTFVQKISGSSFKKINVKILKILLLDSITSPSWKCHFPYFYPETVMFPLEYITFATLSMEICFQIEFETSEIPKCESLWWERWCKTIETMYLKGTLWHREMILDLGRMAQFCLQSEKEAPHVSACFYELLFSLVAGRILKRKGERKKREEKKDGFVCKLFLYLLFVYFWFLFDWTL